MALRKKSSKASTPINQTHAHLIGKRVALFYPEGSAREIGEYMGLVWCMGMHAHSIRQTYGTVSLIVEFGAQIEEIEEVKL